MRVIIFLWIEQISKKRIFKETLKVFKAFRESGKTAVARYTSRGAQHLGLIYFSGGKLKKKFTLLIF